MRLFQNSGLYPAYRPRLDKLTAHCQTFSASVGAFLADRYGAPHFLQPVLEGQPEAFFTNGDDVATQTKWAREQNMPATAKPDEILRAQIEHHRTEVFYNIDPMRFSSDFVRSLPGCVRHSVAWRAAPSPGADFSAYSLVVCNFLSILKSYEVRGWHSGYLAPAHDPVMSRYAANRDRPVDVLFVGGYSRHHRNRAAVLDAVAAHAGAQNTVFHLDRSRLTRLSESPLGHLLPLGHHRRPPAIRNITAEPVFGLALYSALSRAKIVLNGAVDMAGEDRGNMRCFEAMGCGALLVSDTGVYPQGMVDGETLLAYRDAHEAPTLIAHALADPARLDRLAVRGHLTVADRYNKAAQWEDFQRLVGQLW